MNIVKGCHNSQTAPRRGVPRENVEIHFLKEGKEQRGREEKRKRRGREGRSKKGKEEDKGQRERTEESKKKTKAIRMRDSITRLSNEVWPKVVTPDESGQATVNSARVP